MVCKTMDNGLNKEDCFYNAKEISVSDWIQIAHKGYQSVPVMFKVNGTSMFPFISKQKDIVVLYPVRERPKIGDIVLVPGIRKGGNYVLHRVYKIKGDKCRTIGDACLLPDEWIETGSILGKVYKIQKEKLVINCENRFWKLIFRLWLLLLPVRKPLLRILCAISKGKHKIKSIIKEQV